MSVNQALDRLALDAGGLGGPCHRNPHIFRGLLQEHLPQLVAILRKGELFKIYFKNIIVY